MNPISFCVPSLSIFGGSLIISFFFLLFLFLSFTSGILKPVDIINWCAVSLVTWDTPKISK